MRILHHITRRIKRLFHKPLPKATAQEIAFLAAFLFLASGCNSIHGLARDLEILNREIAEVTEPYAVPSGSRVYGPAYRPSETAPRIMPSQSETPPE